MSRFSTQENCQFYELVNDEEYRAAMKCLILSTPILGWMCVHWLTLIIIASFVVFIYSVSVAINRHCKTYSPQNNFQGRQQARFNSILLRLFSTFSRNKLRSNFRNLKINLLKDQTKIVNHTHPTAALMRSTANNAIDDYITSNGFVPYSVSASYRDFQSQNDGQRHYYEAKDLGIENRDDKIQKHHVLKFIDVDYYADMHHYASFGQPIMMYTFAPSSVAGATHDATFTTVMNQVLYRVNGGSTYIHTLNDYEADCLTFDYWWGSQVFLVEACVFGDDHHKIIGLFPLATVYGPFSQLFTSRRLHHRTYSYANFNCMNVQKNVDGKTTVYKSFNLAGDHHSALVRDDMFRTAFIRCVLSKTPAISDVERLFRSADVENPVYAASIFTFQFITNPTSLLNCHNFITIVPTVLDNDTVNYQATGPIQTEDGQLTAQVIGPKVFDDSFGHGFAACKSHNNDVAMYKGRIETPKCHMTKFKPFHKRCVNELNALLIPNNDVQRGVPLTINEVEALQDRVTQRAGNTKARLHPYFDRAKVIVSCFQKAEIYNKICDPRNITTVPPDHRVRFSCFTLAIAKVLKTFDFYAFGKTPAEVCDSVTNLAARSETLCPTDFERFDGTRSSFFVDAELALGLRLFSQEYHHEFSRLSSATINARAFTRFDVHYLTGTSRLSGNPDTSEGNTYDNILTAYITLRSSGNNPTDSFNKLGLYGGDDGLTPDIDPKRFVEVSKSLGLKPKADLIVKGSPLTFLGRLFMDPWSTKNNVCDVRRRLNALHLSVSKLPRDQVLKAKAESYLITDPNTPIVAAWSKMILRLFPTTVVNPGTVAKEISWYSYFPASEQFSPPPFNDPETITVVANNCDLTASRIAIIEKRLNSTNTLQQFDDLPPFFSRSDPSITIDASIGGQVVFPVKHTVDAPTSNQRNETSRSHTTPSAGSKPQQFPKWPQNSHDSNRNTLPRDVRNNTSTKFQPQRVDQNLPRNKVAGPKVESLMQVKIDGTTSSKFRHRTDDTTCTKSAPPSKSLSTNNAPKENSPTHVFKVKAQEPKENISSTKNNPITTTTI